MHDHGISCNKLKILHIATELICGTELYSYMYGYLSTGHVYSIVMYTLTVIAYVSV